jgi:hypothetical protein
VLDVVLALERGDVRAAEGLSTVVAQQVQSAEVVSLAQRVLAWWLLGDGEEFGGYDLATVLDQVSRVRLSRQECRCIHDR